METMSRSAGLHNPCATIVSSIQSIRPRVSAIATGSFARTLPVAVSSLSSLPVPVVGVFSGIVLLGERPGLQEWIALALVVAALFTVLFQPSGKRVTAEPLAPDD